MSGPQIVNENVASVFVLDHSMPSWNSWILLENVYNVLLPAHNIECFRLQMNFFEYLAFLHDL